MENSIEDLYKFIKEIYNIYDYNIHVCIKT
jgi:hypothetical protein